MERKPRVLKVQLELVLALHATKVAQAAVAAAAAQAAVAKRDMQVMQLQWLVIEYLRAKGMLHARGLMEYAEHVLFPPLGVKLLDRRSSWAQLSSRHRELQASILEANPSWKAECIPDKAVQIHSHLSALRHPGDVQASIDKVLLVEGPLSPEQMRFLQCVADAVHCKCELRYKQPPAVGTDEL